MEIKGKPKHIKIENGIYFVTTHTLDFKPLFKDIELADTLLSSIVKVQKLLEFPIYAYVILLHHMHLIFKTSMKNDLSHIMFRLKGFSSHEINKARDTKRKSVWQDRFADHLIRDDKDLKSHLDYIHYNPVKHQLVQRPEDWPWSSYLKFVKGGYYELGWGCQEPGEIKSFRYEVKV